MPIQAVRVSIAKRLQVIGVEATEGYRSSYCSPLRTAPGAGERTLPPGRRRSSCAQCSLQQHTKGNTARIWNLFDEDSTSGAAIHVIAQSNPYGGAK